MQQRKRDFTRNISCSTYNVFHYNSCYFAEIWITFRTVQSSYNFNLKDSKQDDVAIKTTSGKYVGYLGENMLAIWGKYVGYLGENLLAIWGKRWLELTENYILYPFKCNLINQNQPAKKSCTKRKGMILNETKRSQAKK